MARQQSFQDPGVAYHLWRNVESLYQAPLSENRLQNICTCLRDDMDKMYGHFWQVVVNRTEAFGLATAHAKTERHVVDQHGVYRDGRVFCFNNIIFKCVKPSRAGEIYNLITLDARCSSFASSYKGSFHFLTHSWRHFTFSYSFVLSCFSEIRLHEEAAEKSYLYCRRHDFSGTLSTVLQP